MCEVRKKMKGFGGDLDTQTAACRFRLKGPAGETSDAARKPKKDAHGAVIEAYNTSWKNFFQILRDSYGERGQRLSDDCYADFFTYYRKRSETVQEHTAEFDRRHSKAHEEKIDLGDLV